MSHLLWNTFLVLVMFVSKCYNDTKIWKPNTDITDPTNWKQKFEDKECEGLAFSKINTATVFVRSLRVKELILPIHGAIEFDDDESFMQIDDKSDDVLNSTDTPTSVLSHFINKVLSKNRLTRLQSGILYFLFDKMIPIGVNLKPINQNAWGDFENWKSTANLDNPAVPHSHRLPCSNDDLTFPHGLNTSILYDQYINFKGKSFLIGENLYGKTAFESFLQSSIGEEIFKYPRNTLIDDPSLECSVPNLKACDAASNEMNVKCQNPVSPHGFCPGFKICGGLILVDSMSLEKLKAMLKLQEYQSSTYASEISRTYGNKVQVVFTEKEFSGTSLDEIQHFYNLLLEDKQFASKNPQLFMSGPYYEEGLLLRSSLGLIFGTLFGVLLMFGMLFYFYAPSRGEWSLMSLRNSIATARPLSTYIFAKYDNLEEQARIFDGQSMAGSVLSLDRSNDRSKYLNKDSPSTSTASLDTIAPRDNRVVQTKTETQKEGFSEIELSDRKELSVESLDEDLLLREP